VQSQMLVEEVDGKEFPTRHEGLVQMFKRSWIIGSPDRAAEGVANLAAELGCSEMMINPVVAAYSSQPTDRAPNREFTLAALAERLS